MSDTADVDLAIVGAGVAGLAAAKAARAAGLGVRVLEAKDRIGGRALSDAHSLGATWDRGCHWLHAADRNPFTRIADELGFRYKQDRSPHRSWLGERWATDAEMAEGDAFMRRCFDRIGEAGAAGRDVAAVDLVPADSPWAPLFRQYLGALTGAAPEDCSSLDDARYVETGENWPVRDGYGNLIAAWGADVPVTLATPVRRIAHDDHGVTLRTADATLRARAAIVTASTSVLAADGIAFDPALPWDVVAALEATPLGGANKVALAFDRDVFGTGMHYVTSLPHAPRGMGFQITPFGRPIAVGHLGGRFAMEMEAAGPEAMRDLGLEILAAMFGTRVSRHLTAWTTTAWHGDPEVRGGYSIALPGRAHLRPRLTAPVAERLWLAGEACDLAAFGTANGAFASGTRAARGVAATLGAGNSDRPAGVGL